MTGSNREWVRDLAEGLKEAHDEEARAQVLRTILVPRPAEEWMPLTREELSDYRAIAGFLIFLSLGVVFVLDVWALGIGARWQGALLGTLLLLSLTVPLALALLTLRKVFLAVGCGALGSVMIGVVAVGLIAATSAGGSGNDFLGGRPELAPVYVAGGLGLFYLAYRLLRREEPFYGLR